LEAAEKQQRVDAFCRAWGPVMCKVLFRCHPGVTPEMTAGCVEFVRPHCEARIADRSFDPKIAEACFADLSGFDCSLPLNEAFKATRSCDQVFQPTAGEGESCDGTWACEPGLVCQHGKREAGRALYCGGRCGVPVKEGGDCSVNRVCEEGASCHKGIDDRGLDTFTCIVEDDPGERPSPCEPWQTEVSDTDGTRCVDRSLPGTACGGVFRLSCLGTTECVNGTCSASEDGVGAACSSYSCTYPYQCVDAFGRRNCATVDSNCRSHPAMLEN
jgi:hypothetical protein